jgi:hypothetical protein
MARLGERGQYGGPETYIEEQYNDSEKAALWNERGDETRFKWQAGKRRPEPTSNNH